MTETPETLSLKGPRFAVLAGRGEGHSDAQCVLNGRTLAVFETSEAAVFLAKRLRRKHTGPKPSHTFGVISTTAPATVPSETAR